MRLAAGFNAPPTQRNASSSRPACNPQLEKRCCEKKSSEMRSESGRGMAVRYRSRIALGLTGPIERETPFGQPAITNFESIYPIVIASPFAYIF